MKKILVTAILLAGGVCFAADDLSKQATAFYSDNNYQKTMDLILQIPEDKRSAQDWLLLGNILDDKGERDNAVFMYQKAVNINPKYYKAYYNLANNYLENGQYNMALQNYKKASIDDFVYRFIKSVDLAELLRLLNKLYLIDKSSLEELFYEKKDPYLKN